jgi:transcriptional regulator with XRE-family HTH domain
MTTASTPVPVTTGLLAVVHFAFDRGRARRTSVAECGRAETGSVLIGARWSTDRTLSRLLDSGQSARPGREDTSQPRSAGAPARGRKGHFELEMRPFELRQRGVTRPRLSRGPSGPEYAARMREVGQIRGELLRRWRVAELRDDGAPAVMAATGMTRGAVSQWESGVRAPAPEVVRLVAGLAPRHESVFVTMLERAGTPFAFAAASRWEHNFPGSHRGPAAIWVRGTEPGQIAIRARWGILEARRTRFVDELGLVLWVPTSVANPTLIVDVAPAGFVDFLTSVPPRSLGIPVEQALRYVHRQSTAGPWAVLWSGYVTGRPGLLPRLSSLAYGRRREEALVASIASPERSDTEDVAAPTEPPESRREPITTGSAVRRARVAYALSQSDLAARAAALSGLSMSQSTQSRLEADVRTADPLVAAAVDRALGADGRIASHEYRSMVTGSGTVRFPSFWVGPVWAMATGPGSIELTCGGYRRRVALAVGVHRYAFRCGGPDPFQVEAHPAQRLVFGLGRVDGSIDVNDDWVPASEHDRRRILEEGYAILSGVVLSLRTLSRRVG